MLMTKADTVEELENELARLNADGASTCAQIDDLEAHEATIEDPDALLGALAATRAARNKLARIDRDIAALRDRIAIARDAVRAKLRSELLAAFGPAAQEFLKTARATQAAFERLVTAREALAVAGFAVDYRTLPVPPGIGGAAMIAPDLLDMFEAGLSQKPTLALAAPVHAGPPHTPSPATATIAETSAVTERRPWAEPSRPPRRESAAKGERLFLMQRGRLDHPRKGSLQAGDIVSLAPAEAVPLIRAGTGDFVTPAEVSALNAIAGIDPEEQAQ
ncbi:MAG: hypothetical protein ACXWIW_10240 [Croceibacterium sp.]